MTGKFYRIPGQYPSKLQSYEKQEIIKKLPEGTEEK
jgi:hypothetical protein